MFPKSEIQTKLDAEINSALEKLEAIPDKTSKDYGNLVDHISRLHKLKAEEKPKQVNPDTMVIVAANVVGILMILNHERLHPITSKALNFVAKPW